MSDTDHYPFCWQLHPACALARIAELESENKRLENALVMAMVFAREYIEGHTQSGPVLTHEVVIPLHASGPTWAARSDEPPVR